ncbi:hypothetical protein [Cellulomonas terrae]|uniref:Gram-positive cocci surface proteins LPxTG domain-containing protein n=1 Tax=Cellulomonas terrae TaxID=311234 RepID=A0A511JH67_9CELL|nr:hypothetical protein [Cellulomonas terrae]GEL97342.1 hypothetical protein CTE05_08890 [Cellulomonas terrae]
MHPTLVRLPAVVALAASLTVVPAAAFATPPDAVRQGNSSGSDAGAEPQEAGTGSSTHDMEDMEGADAVDDMEGMPDMEGMDHGDGSTETDDEPAEHSEHSQSTGGDSDATTSTARPRTAVLSAFGGLNAAVLVGAAVLRRRDRDRPRHRPRPSATPTAV